MELAYVILPALMVLVVLAAVWLERWSVPVILVALGAGILFGTDVLGLWDFSDVAFTNRMATLALVFVLFHGGFSTKRTDIQAVALPAGGLATWGVILTAGFTYIVLHYALGWGVDKALLLAVIVSSTDAAAIFSILRRQSLPRKLATTVELESAANDPMAILLTLVAIGTLASGADSKGMIVLSFLWKFGMGPVVGYLAARASIGVFNRLQPEERGYYYVLFLGLVVLTYGVAEIAQASGMLAVFTAGLVMGNKPFVHKQGTKHFSEAISTTMNIGLFVMLGLLVFPSQLALLWLDGTILFLVITFISRPAAVFIGTFGMGIPFKHLLLISWAGLRGAVPIVLGTYALASGLEVGAEVFNLVFFAVLLSILIQGSTLAKVADLLGLSEPSRPRRLFDLELLTMAKTDYDLVVVELPDLPCRQPPRLRDLLLPEGAVIVLITRGREVILPKGNTHLQPADNVTLLAHAPDESAVRHALIEPFMAAAEAAEHEWRPELEQQGDAP